MKNELEREETSASTKLAYLLIGGCIGAGIALLLAPKSGQQLREEFADKARAGIKTGKEVMDSIKESVMEENVVQPADEAVEETYKSESGTTETAEEDPAPTEAASGLEGTRDVDF